ncbi:Uncharacterised protein [Vibrio cholerae]|nr:Uncharacterised protein [Vibrio cholerae]
MFVKQSVWQSIVKVLLNRYLSYRDQKRINSFLPHSELGT